MLPSRSLLTLLLTLPLIACGGTTASPGGGSSVTNAAIGTGLAVAAAGINRAITHECWSVCRPGLVCDRSTGLCVEAGSASHPPSSSRAPLEPIEANTAGREYEVPALDAGGGGASDDPGAR